MVYLPRCACYQRLPRAVIHAAQFPAHDLRKEKVDRIHHTRCRAEIGIELQ